MGFEGVENECMGVKEHEVVKFFQKFLNVFMLLNFILGLNFINFFTNFFVFGYGNDNCFETKEKI